MAEKEKTPPRIWTEKEKTEMLRMRADGKSNREIGERYNVSGDIVRKVMARVSAPRPAPPEQKREAVKAKPEAKPEPKMPAPAAKADRLARLHDEFDAKVPERRTSRPAWAGRPPLRVTPKDFQNG